MKEPVVDFIALGGNRHSSAADWAQDLLAFGAGNHIALWDPDHPHHSGISCLLSGHTDVVNAVKFYENDHQKTIISGSADHSIRIWTRPHDGTDFVESQRLTEHNASINTISALATRGLFVCGSADGIIKVWRFSNNTASLLQSIVLRPHFIILATAVSELSNGALVLAVTGTCNFIQVYVSASENSDFTLQATLRGHEGWIRSLDFTCEKNDDSSDLILASASQDKYIRLWRFRKDHVAVEARPNGDTPAKQQPSLTNKAHQLTTNDGRYAVSFEALLIGHEDWVYTARWRRDTTSSSPLLLTSSADNSLSIWHAEESSGLWVCQTRLGEISSQKGSSTATGSVGGFWIGLWQPAGLSVVSLARSGSWRRWTYDATLDLWEPQIGISGHTREVQGLAWSPDGSYLLSTSSDQTTRMFAEWRRDTQSSWHEFARPQIHGYDLNCIDTISQDRFISGADEKLLRVFDKPKNVGDLLSSLSGLSISSKALPEPANIPVLGLSNKAVAANEDNKDDDPGSTDVNESTPAAAHPPLEDQLARHTLWPEHEKLYGHGYEISCVATSTDGSLVATACKASSTDHAVIRLYETQEWREIKPSLNAHSLTVTSLAFSSDNKYLLSVGRDRQWAVFARQEDAHTTYEQHIVNPKGHSRMILDCSWAPAGDRYVFATAGRDKSVKIWLLKDGRADCASVIASDCSVTAVAFEPTHSSHEYILAFGDENGRVRIARLDRSSLASVVADEIAVAACPSQGITSLRWRPGNSDRDNLQLAVASDDFSVRILNVPSS